MIFFLILIFSAGISNVICVGYSEIMNKSQEIVQKLDDENKLIYEWGDYFVEKTTNETVKVSKIINTASDDLYNKVTENITTEMTSKFDQSGNSVTANINKHIDEKVEDLRTLANQLNDNTKGNIDSKFNILGAKMEGINSNSDNIVLKVQTKLDEINLPSFSNNIVEKCSDKSKDHKNEIKEDIRLLSQTVKDMLESIKTLRDEIDTFSSDVMRKLETMSNAIQEIKSKN